MRIWIVNHYATPPGSKGGPSRHLGLSRALARKGHDVTIFASAYDHYTRTPHRRVDGRSTVVEDIDGVRYVWIRTPPYAGVVGRVRNMVSFARAVAREAPDLPIEPPEVVIGSSPHLLAPLASRRVARRLRAGFVMEVRDLWPQSLIDLGEMSSRHPLMLVLRQLERSLYRSADQIISVPPGALSYIASHGGDAARITHIPNGVEVSAWPLEEDPGQRAGGLFTVVYAGTLGHANGLEVAVEAGRLLARAGEDEIRIRLVGAGPERDRLRSLAQGAGGLVSVEDPVTASEVPSLLRSADACLMVLRDSPVFRWGISPTKLFEYFAAGRPVVFSVRTPTNLVADLAGGVTADPGDARSLADAVLRLRDVPAVERGEMGRRLRRHAEAHHSFDALADEVERVAAATVPPFGCRP